MHRYVSDSTKQRAAHRAGGIQSSCESELKETQIAIMFATMSHLFLFSSHQVADLSEFRCADTADGDHYVSIRNFCITLIIWVRESIYSISYYLCFIIM